MKSYAKLTCIAKWIENGMAPKSLFAHNRFLPPKNEWQIDGNLIVIVRIYGQTENLPHSL